MADRKVVVLNSAGYQELFQGSDKLVLDGSAEFKSNVHIDGNLSVTGTSVTFDAVTLTVDDINIELGAIKEVHNIAVTPENLAYTLSDGSNSVTTSALGASPTIATLVTAIEAASGYSSLAFTVTANANSNGIHLAYKTLGAQSESATLTKAGGSPISASAVTNVSDATANGGGITLYGSTAKTFNWVSSTGSWTSSENIDLASGKGYKINGTSVLTNNTLGSGVTGSSLTSVGTITTGTWNGTAISQAYGGTGHGSYSNGQLLVGKADGSLAKAFLTQGTNTVITNGDGSIEIVAKDTTYTISAEQTGGSDADPDIKITAGGNGSTVSSTIALVGSGATSVTRNSGTQITVSSTDTTHTLSATEDSGDVRLSLDNSGGNVTLTGGNATTITRTSSSEITITGQDTTYSAATTSAAGLMSATDKTQLDALHAGSNVNYLRANADDDFTGTLAHNNPGGVALYVRGGDSVTPLLRVSSQGADATATDTSGVYGFSLTYNGTGTGNNNTLNLYSDNQQAQSQTHVYSVTQDGVLDFKVAPTISSNAVLTSATTFGGDVSGTYNSIVVADNSHDHTIANITSLASTLAGKYATSGGSLSGKVTISAGSTTEPLLIEGTATDKIGLKGASNPRIVLYEGTTETGHIQWNTSGYIEIKNAEDASSLRIKDTLDFSLDGSTYYNIYHTGADVQISDSHKINFGAGDDLQIYHDGSNSFIHDGGTGGLFIRAANTLGFRDVANSNANWANFNSGGAIDLYHNGIKKFETTSSGVTITGALTATTGVTPGGNITMQDNEKIIFGAGNDLQIYHDTVSQGGPDDVIHSSANCLRTRSNIFRANNEANNSVFFRAFNGAQFEAYWGGGKKFETITNGIQVTGRIHLNGTNGGFDYNNTAHTLEFLVNGSTHSELNTGAYVPSSNGGKNLGASSVRWGTVYGQTGEFTSSLNVDGANAPNSFAYLNIGSSGSGETRAIDIDGNWGAGESKSISFTHASNAADLVGQIQCVHQSPGSMIQFGRLYHSGNSSVYPLKLYSTSASAAALSLNGSAVWHAGNDGAGSGLDADQLDGIQASSFLRSDTSDTMSGMLTLTGSGENTVRLPFVPGTSNNQNPHHTIEFWEGTSVGTSSDCHARIVYDGSTSHGGDGAIVFNGYVGINTNTDIAWFSRDGNAYAQSSYRAPIFYDRDNTNYYVNPAGTSVFNSLSVNGAAISGYALQTNGHVHVNNNNIDYVNQLHFTDGVRFVGTDTNQYLKYKWNGTGGGGIRFYDGDDTHHGYIYGDGNGRFGLLDNDGAWSVKIGTGTEALQLHCNNDLEFEVTETYTKSLTSSRAPLFYDSDDTAFVVNPAGDSTINGLFVDANIYFKNAITTDDGRGIYFNGGNSKSYAIYREAGSWSSPYPDLVIGFHTGIKLGAHTGYGGTRFYSNSPGDSNDNLIMEVGNGNNNVRVVNTFTASGDSRAPVFYDSTNTSYYTDPTSTSYMQYIGRRDHNVGCLVGSYNNVGGNSAKSNPIYANGSSYLPNNDTLSNFYGIGYSHPDASFTPSHASDWGMYVAADGDARVYLDGGTGKVIGTGGFYGASFSDHSNSSYYLDPAESSTSLNVAGAIIAGGSVTSSSDLKFKEDIKVIPDAVEKVKAIRGVTYTRNDLADREERHTGVIAQEVEQVLPEAVRERFNGKTVAYGNMIGLLIEAIKEQQKQIDELRAKLL